MNPGPLVIEITGLTRECGQFVAWDRLTMSVEREQTLGFVGPNGSDKTTTIKILVGFARRTKDSALTVDSVAAVLKASETPEFVQYELLSVNWGIIGFACIAMLTFLNLRTWQLNRPE